MALSSASFSAARSVSQTRSEITLHRILDASELLLADRSWEQLTITDVCAKAGVAVGTFYGRLKNKEALLHCLDERLLRDLQAQMRSAFDEGKWCGRGFSERLSALVDAMIKLHRERRGIIRALILVPRLRPDASFEATGQEFAQFGQRIAQFLLAAKEPIAHPDAPKALAFALASLMTLIREAIVFPESTLLTHNLDDETLKRELVRQSLAYLGIEQ